MIVSGGKPPAAGPATWAVFQSDTFVLAKSVIVGTSFVCCYSAEQQAGVTTVRTQFSIL
jgi:hypothetical protein